MTDNMSDTTHINRTGYDRWSDIYDSAVNSTVAVDDMHFPALWADVAGKDVLEIGCGTGRHTLRLARQGNRVTALDLSPGMLAQARAKLAGFEVRLIERDIMAGGDDLGLYDVIVTALVMEHIEDIETFFVCVAASLKPGGRFFMSEVEPARLAAGGVARFYDPATGERHDMKSFAHDAVAILAAAARAGLTLVREQDVLGDARLTAVKSEWARHAGKPMIRMWEFRK